MQPPIILGLNGSISAGVTSLGCVGFSEHLLHIIWVIIGSWCTSTAAAGYCCAYTLPHLLQKYGAELLWAHGATEIQFLGNWGHSLFCNSF